MNFRTIQERVAEIDDKVAFHNKHITILLQKKEKLLMPRKQRMTYAKVFNELKKSGLRPEDIMKLMDR